MKFKLRIWRQASGNSKGKLANFEISDISPATSFLEMLDIYEREKRSVSAKRSQSYAPTLFAKDKRCRGFKKADLASCSTT